MDLIVNNYKITPDLPEILHRLEIEAHISFGRIKKTGDSLMVCCPVHEEDHPSCGVVATPNAQDPRLVFGQFNCLACGAKGSLVDFVAACFECSSGEAKRWLCQNFGTLQSEALSVFADMDPIPMPMQQTTKTPKMSEAVLASMQSWHPYMAKRKLTPQVCETFKVKYDPKTTSLTFPVWDEKGELYMLTRRSVVNKTFLIDKQKEKPVYLLNFIKQWGLPYMIVCESQINALYCHSLGFSAVATFGCHVTTKQAESLRRSGVSHLIIGFDGDAAGEQGAEQLKKLMGGTMLIDTLTLPPGKDLNDLSPQEVDAVLQKAGLDPQQLRQEYQKKSFNGIR